MTKHAHTLFETNIVDVPLPNTEEFGGGLVIRCKSVNGDVNLMNRKGRAICCLQEINLEFTFRSCDETIQGSVRCADVENTTAHPDCEYTVSAGKSCVSATHGPLMPFLKKHLPPFVHSLIQGVVTELQGETAPLPKPPAWAAEGPVVVESPAKSVATTPAASTTPASTATTTADPSSSSAASPKVAGPELPV